MQERPIFYAKGKILNLLNKIEEKKFNPNEFINPEIYVSFEIPFDPGLSKNKLYFGKGRVFHSQAYKISQEKVQWLYNSKKQVFKPNNKIWLDIYVEKPNHRADAINMIDGIADALKKVIGIDDKWFSVRRLDWNIVKKNPMIFIGIGQEKEKFICKNCYRFLPLEKKANKILCKDCKDYKNKNLFQF